MRENCNDCGIYVFGETCNNDFRRILPRLIGAFLIGDPAMDVAYTLHTTIPAMLIYPDIDPVQYTEKYLNTYRRTRPLDEPNMAYYLTFRNVMALIEGTQGHVLLGIEK